MLLCLDVGNSQVFGGLFDKQNHLVMRFRMSSKSQTSDEFAIFLVQVLRENHFEPKDVKHIAISSVVPHFDYSIRAACIKYFSITPFFVHSGMKSPLNIQYVQSRELGADRIANAIAALDMYPQQNLIIIDFGTAMTFCAIDKNAAFLGGAIFPGMRLLVDTLAKNTAKLPVVEVIAVEEAVAKTTVTGIQSGIFFGTLGACRELIATFRKEVFNHEQVKIIATGGFSGLFEKSGIYDVHVPDLILHGIRIAAKDNGIYLHPKK
jgi:type III pantothenate kinase